MTGDDDRDRVAAVGRADGSDGIRPADAPAFLVAQSLGAAAATAFSRWLVATRSDGSNYRSSPALRRRFNKEFRFMLMGDLRGKAVLDVGCGDGLNAVMLARLGARVTGVDVSPRAVALLPPKIQPPPSPSLTLAATPTKRSTPMPTPASRKPTPM